MECSHNEHPQPRGFLRPPSALHSAAETWRGLWGRGGTVLLAFRLLESGFSVCVLLLQFMRQWEEGVLAWEPLQCWMYLRGEQHREAHSRSVSMQPSDAIVHD